MSDEVVYCSESIEWTAQLTGQQRVEALARSGCRSDFEYSVGSHRGNEFSVACVWLVTSCELDPDNEWFRMQSYGSENPVCLELELLVRLNDQRITMSATRIAIP